MLIATLLLFACMASASATGFGQFAGLLNPENMPRRYEVRHADPYVIVALLQGISVPYPEISTLSWFTGGQIAMSGNGGWLIEEGILIVNPTDNSIWYLPRLRPAGGPDGG